MVGRHEEYLASEKPVPPDSKGFFWNGWWKKIEEAVAYQCVENSH